MDANNLRVKDLLILISLPVILIGGGVYLASFSIKILYAVYFLLLGLFFLVLGFLILKRKRTESGDYLGSHIGGSGSAVDVLYLILVLLSPLLKDKEGAQAVAVGFFFIIISVVLLVGAVWLGIPEYLRVSR